MTTSDQPIEEILLALQERAKELNCLYRVDEVLSHPELTIEEAMRGLLRVLPPGLQFPEACAAKITLHGKVYQPPNFQETAWALRSAISFQGEAVGELAVYYTESRPGADEGPFLKEERRLIDTISERIGYLLMQKKLKQALVGFEHANRPVPESAAGRWTVILEFLRGTDRKLLMRITRRMINQLCWSGVAEAEELLQRFALEPARALRDDNQPQARTQLQDFAALAEQTFRIASAHLSEEEMLGAIQGWIREEKSRFLYAVLENLDTSLPEIAEALQRFHALAVDEAGLPPAVQTGLRVALLRRFFSDQPDFIHRAQEVVSIEDFHDLIGRIVLLPASHGKLGGKSAGLFVASRIVKQSVEYDPLLGDIRTPRTWYLPSDGLLQFIRYNNLEDVYDRKYRELTQIRQEYPYLVQVFKNSPFPPELIKGLAAALDDFADRPIIVRSSSLLEDRVGSAFSGKYKSLFLANQGSKPERLAALQDAIAEVYASIFGPDPIGYRAERGLLDVHEEMGIMIQEVVGRRVGDYFLPAFSGVAFSNNEFRWSSRIRREDGLVRMVPGLGTRAVDRLRDDYPVLLAPGQPGLRVNVTPEEIVRYAPKKIDVLDLRSNSFETIDMDALLARHGADYPMARRMLSLVEDGEVRRPTGLSLDFGRRWAVTFEGLIAESSFVPRMRALLRVLRERLGVPVDIEFASDGEHFYLLQCRPQSYSAQSAPAAIPRDLPADKLLFTANRYVSNGRVPDVTHIVYVDHESYQSLESAQAYREAGEAIGQLNELLPKRQFILIGPGRWGSRGDVKLGVNVTYSQIRNTAMLVEVAWKKGNYVPDLSFGTHFFQDLVEAGIRYLPLYPDDPDVSFNEPFFMRAHNILPELLPVFAHLAPTIRVIDIPRQTGGRVLRVLMNADLDEAVGVLSTARAATAEGPPGTLAPALEPTPEDHWRWRLRMAERIAAELDPERFGVEELYVFGSTKNATAGPGSDIDLIVHFGGSAEQRRELELWLEAWSLCLGEINYLRTGYQAGGLLDVHFVTDLEIERQSSFAAKIGAVTDPAHRLKLKSAAGRPD